MAADNLPARVPSSAMQQPISTVSPEYAESAISPGQISTIIWAFRWYSLLIFLGVLSLAILTAVALPRTYEATTTLMVNFDVYDPLGGREFPVGLLGSYMATQVELARGSEVLLPVVDRLELTKDSDYTAGYSGDEAGLRYWVESRLRKRLTVDQGRFGSQLIFITYTAPDAEEAARVANAVADVYSERQAERLANPAEDRAERYTAQLAELRDKVNSAQALVSDFQKENSIVDSDAGGNVNMQLLNDLEHRLQDARQVRRVAEARVSSNPAFGEEAMGSTMVQSLKTQLATLSTSLAQMRASLGARHPDVLALRSQIEVNEQALAAQERDYGQNARAQLTSARRLENELETAVQEQHNKVLNIREVQGDGAEHQLELASAQSVYQKALEGYDQIMFASAAGYTNVSMVSRAAPPPAPSSPKVLLLIVAGVVLGLGLALTLPLLFELINRRVRSSEDMERDHGVPVLAELGRLRPPDSRIGVRHAY